MAQTLLYSGINSKIKVPGRDQEMKALRRLYEETGGESWSIKDGWLGDSDHCDWHGIKCNEDLFVSAVELQRNNLVGKFPFNSLSELKKLETLDVSENKLTGVLDDVDAVAIEDITATYVGGGDCLSGENDYLYTSFEHEDSSPENAVTAEFCDNFCRGDKISTGGSNLVGFEIYSFDVENFVQAFNEGSGMPGTACACLYSDGELPLPLKDGVTMYEENPAAFGPVKSSAVEYLDVVCYGYTPPSPVRFESCRVHR